ncbi:membrane protein [Microlunatus panaciterrae]|uniref:Membrane protein YczE n=1 Tax=Microlunatus panaciterrae TaxID=400768 RepID=A0ABS2RF35_9ACTN|nr:hypothetical protein [Microlunatus panaciterrae]MBM7797152.1 putative membrane protein YczE [Microlunatus panaciterrae]
MPFTLKAGPRYDLPKMTPIEQLRAGRLARRLPQLFFGLFLFGFSMAMMVQAGLGLDPWDVLHQGLARFVPLSFGTITIGVGVIVLLLWIPLRQWPGFGTVANAIVVGLAADFGLAVLPAPESMTVRITFMLLAIVLNGLAGAIYIGSQLGPGPRDGLMTGLAARTSGSLRLIRTSIEVSVLVIGFLLGGTVGVGTVLYAVGIGPLVQFFLPLVAVRVERPTRLGATNAAATALESA